MDNLSVIDQFLETFIRFIESGFGLLQGDVNYLSTTLIVIDITLAGLFWAMSENTNVIAQLLKKVLYVGFFAFIITNFAFLSNVVFDSFAGLGLRAGGSSLTAADIMRPGFVANTGFSAAAPLLTEIGELTGPVGFFVHFVTISILGISWVIVVFAFFLLAIQLFITIIEFKLTALVGFVLVPFALWNKTTFLAERVLGNVITSGVKLMVLTVIVAIGSTLFAGLSANLASGDIRVVQALSTVLGALSVFGLGIFGPGIASGLISGAPQLGAGAAIGAVGGAAAGAAAGIGAAKGAAGAVGAAGSAVKAGASLAGGAGTAFSMAKAASGKSGLSGAAAGTKGIARAGGDVAKKAVMKPVNAVTNAARQGSAKSFQATGGSSSKGTVANKAAGNASSDAANDNWGKRFQQKMDRRHAASMAASSVRGGDGGGAGANPSLDQREEG